ncbi:MAG: nitrate reductase [Proteobacteria bacterium]|jgi:nitrate reductase gamma subunit|nr:nitrate reductase [Pseudomonadota bacterium]
MDTAALLQFARGPALAFAVAVLVLGTAWRLLHLLLRPARRSLAEPRAKSAAGGALRAIVTRMWQPAAFRADSLPATLHAYAYHIGLAIVFFGFAPHIAFIERYTGWRWPAVPGWLFALAAAAVFVGLGYALVNRLTSPVLRLISGFDDYAAWAITLLPVVTGMAVLTLPLDAQYPLHPVAAGPLAVHLLSVELLLVWLPFGKLSHAFLAFVSRGATGAAFARRGTQP